MDLDPVLKHYLLWVIMRIGLLEFYRLCYSVKVAQEDVSSGTVPTDKVLSFKNARVWVSMIHI